MARQDSALLLLGAMALLWGTTFIALGWLRHERFGTFGFDLAIYDQGIWLLSRLKEPFITVRGLHLFGHHVNPILFLFVPFYWLGAGAKFLIMVQTMLLAVASVAVFLIAKNRLRDNLLGVTLAGAFLLHPSLQWLAWDHGQPEILSVAPLLFAWWSAERKRWGWFAIFAVLAAACKQSVPLSLAALGILIAFRGERRAGVATAVLAGAWFLAANQVVIPHFNKLGPLYSQFFAAIGSTPMGVVSTLLTEPAAFLKALQGRDRLTYTWQMFAPFAMMPLAATRFLLIAAPVLAINLLTSWPYARQIRWHYSSVVLVGLIVATVEGFHRLGGERDAPRRFLAGFLLASSLAASIAWGPSPIGVEFRKGIWPLGEDPRRTAKHEAVALVPRDAAVTATYYFVPHLSHRTKIYEFPVPWRPANWGIKGEGLHDPKAVRWLVVDMTLLGPDDRRLVDRLVSKQFATRYLRDNILVAERLQES